MNCRQLQESLGDHSVGLLDSQTLTEFELHVSLCAECAKTVRQFRRVLELLDHTASPRPPVDLWMGVRAGMEVERAVQAHVHHARRVPVRWPWRSGLAATAAGFATAAILMIGLSAQRPSGMAVVDDQPISGVPVSLNPSGVPGSLVTLTHADTAGPWGQGIRIAPDGTPFIVGMPPEMVPARPHTPHRFSLHPHESAPWPDRAIPRDTPVHADPAGGASNTP